jgi:hypothetical protein
MQRPHGLNRLYSAERHQADAIAELDTAESQLKAAQANDMKAQRNVARANHDIEIAIEEIRTDDELNRKVA